MEKITLQLPDGSEKEYPKGVTSYEVAESISKRLAEDALAAAFNDAIVDVHRPIDSSGRIRLLTFDDPEGKHVYWHSTSHVMAHAIEELYPGAKFGVGPAIEHGFYYDIDIGERLSDDDLKKIESKMREIVERGESFQREVLPKEAAVDFFRRKNDPYKLELLGEIDGENEIVSLYHEGAFTDLCRGPHLPDTKKIRHFKLLSVSGSYWRGDSGRQMLQRIYGISSPKKKYIDEYLEMLEEAKRRDHRKLGRELDLFMFHEISPGAPFWLPKGMIVFRELEKFIRAELDAADYDEISTPILVKKKLWEQSGHWDHYQENMFLLNVDDETFSLKPMNCPESTYVYKTKVRSYKDLPIRLSEIGRLHRNEITGALGGMFRVRQITMDDAHLFVRPDQILDEIDGLIEMIRSVYVLLGFEPTFSLATRPDDSMGDPALWEQAERALEDALKRNDLTFALKEKDGAFYGPKIDIQIKDALGRMWQLATIQLDFQMPERFDLEYVNENGDRVRPVMIHRAVFGSFERFIGILVEHFAGAFPTWLAPVQAVVLPISDAHHAYAAGVRERLKEEGVRAELDLRNEKIGYKIRDWETQKVPYMLVIGNKELENRSVSVRRHHVGDLGSRSIESFTAAIADEIRKRKLANPEAGNVHGKS
jgi:threonyl-tRNA synthetase